MMATAEILGPPEAIERQLSYMPVDALPEIAEARLHARREAYEIVEQNRQLLCEGQFDAVAMPVDALGTARRVVEAEQQFGPGSVEVSRGHRSLVLDCQRLIAEARRKNTWEYFPPLRQPYDEETSSYISHGFSILDMTKAALTPVAEPEELDRRINERVEEVTYGAVRRLGGIALAGQQARVRTISPCTDWAIEAHHQNSKGGYGGYVPEIQKRMIRDVRFDPLTNDRYEEQIGVSGVYITDQVVDEALARRGIDSELMTKTELHGTQLAVTDDVLSFVELLDVVAGEQTGQHIFMGEVVPADHDKNYRLIRSEAAGRQAETETQSQELAAFVFDLQKAGEDSWVAVGLVEERVKQMLLDRARNNNAEAADMFDEATARGYETAAALRSQGKFEEATLLLNQVEAAAPAPAYCGAGSCGLEAVRVGTALEKEAKSLGLDSSKGILKDTERKCPSCNNKTIIYDLVNKKGCTSCGTTAKYK